MKTLVSIFLLGLVVFFLIRLYQTPYGPCDTPLTYKIGSIDPKFGLTEKAILTAVEDGTKILEDSYGKNLFTYESGSGEITVDFVYDQRTAMERSINKKQNEIADKNSTLKKQIDKYEADVKVFEQKINNLNAEIKKYNNQGGAPPEIYKELVDRQNKLRAEGNALNVLAKQLNLDATNYNSQINSFNDNVSEFNQALVEKPEEGLFDGSTKTISIYFVDNKPEMIHTLAHEFGHSIGMEHVNSQDAVMYPYTTKSLTVTKEDLEQLNIACKNIPLPLHWQSVLSEKLFELRQKYTGKQGF